MVFGRIYSIRTHQTDDIYVGSTTQILCRRMCKHRSHFKHIDERPTKIGSSCELMKYDDAYIELLEEQDFESKDAMRKCEGKWIRQLKCVNKRIEGRSLQEWKDDNIDVIVEKRQQYYEKNKDEKLEKAKEYRENNKEKVKESNKKWREENKEIHKEKVTCECGCKVRKDSLKRHYKSRRHINFIKIST